MLKRIAGLCLTAAVLLGTGVGGASPAACVSPCEIQATGAGYLTPALVIESGTTVVFTTVEETSHPTGDTTDPFGRCFFALVGYGEPPKPVRFDVADQTVFATTNPGTEYEATSACATATQIPGEAYILPFLCQLHAWMRGEIVIEPDSI